MSANLVAILYLVSGVLFILALRGLSHPESSRQGNMFGMVGMGIAIVTTLFAAPPAGFGTWAMIIAGLAIGGGAGAVIAKRIEMTAMPQLGCRVSLSGRSGGCSGGGCCALCAGCFRHWQRWPYPHRFTG